MKRETRNGERFRIEGFTLVELLVVIAIIAILAGLFLTSLARSRMAADRVVCTNNERQLGVALRLYVDDQGVYPYELAGIDDVLPNPLPDGSRFWAYSLESYANAKWPINNMLGNGQFDPRNGVFTCPGFTPLPGWYADPDRTASFWFMGNHLDASGAYGYNDHARGLANALPSPQLNSVPLKEAAVLKPSQMIAITDSFVGRLSWQVYPPIDPSKAGNVFNGSISVWGGWWSGDFPNQGDPAREAEVMKAYGRRHNGRFNVLFCDSHIESSLPGDLFGPAQESVRRWHQDNEP